MIKYISNIFLFLALSAAAMDNEDPITQVSHDVTIRVNNQSITCKAMTQTKLSLCMKNGNLSGMVFWHENFTAPFFPVLFEDTSPILDLRADIEASTAQELANTYTFKWYDFASLPRSSLLSELSKALARASSHEIQSLANQLALIPGLGRRLDQLKADNGTKTRRQELKCYSNIFKSRLISDDSPQGSNGCTIAATSSDSLSEPQLKFLETLQFAERNLKLSLEEAESIFRHVVAMKDIPWAYQKDGCYARAHLVCARLKNLGYDVGKIWVKAHLKDPKAQDTNWHYHVAPMIFVSIDGAEEARIIDPTLNPEKLLTIEEWLSALNLKNTHLRKIVRYPLPENGNDFEDILICYSSPKPLFPYSISLEETAEARLSLTIQDICKYQKMLQE